MDKYPDQGHRAIRDVQTRERTTDSASQYMETSGSSSSPKWGPALSPIRSLRVWKESKRKGNCRKN